MEKAIIRNSRKLGDYSFHAIGAEPLELMTSTAMSLSDTNVKVRLLCLLECYLQVTNQKIEARTFCQPCFLNINLGFIGALQTERLIDIPRLTRFRYSTVFLRIIKQLQQQISEIVVPEVHFSTVGVTDTVREYAERFADSDLDQEKVWFWQGWPSVNRSGKVTWLPLHPFYRRLGRKFTQQLYDVCDDYYSGRRNAMIYGLRPLAEFVEGYPSVLDKEQLKDPLYMGKFWREFFVYYMESGHQNGAGAKVSSLVSHWRTHFLGFAENYLIPSGLFGKSWGALPNPRVRPVLGRNTHLKVVGGKEVRTKLLTAIPLQITDEEASNLLFQKIEADLATIVNWAKLKADEMWLDYENRCRSAPEGKARILQESGFSSSSRGDRKNSLGWLTDWENPDCLRNAAATFTRLGFTTEKDTAMSCLYPAQLRQVARKLALPVTGALLPFCVLLVANHPEITPSFLEKLQLFDKHGQRIGFVKTDAGYFLVSRKDRRGGRLAQQSILLNETTTKAVERVITLTDPLRDYLRAHHDESWRWLLLTCGQGFGYPRRWHARNETHTPQQVEKLAQSLSEAVGLTIEEGRAYALSFSLPALRASAGVLVYLRSKSVEEMAKALGHKSYKPDLLSRYLPEPLQAFFQERWIRVFQNGIVAEALKGSCYLLEASDFNSMKQLDEFLNTHSLKALSSAGEESESGDGLAVELDRPKTEIVFGVDTGILTILVSLLEAVKSSTIPVNAYATYWAEIADRLISYIDGPSADREDLKSFLNDARLAANGQSMGALISI